MRANGCRAAKGAWVGAVFLVCGCAEPISSPVEQEAAGPEEAQRPDETPLPIALPLWRVPVVAGVRTEPTTPMKCAPTGGGPYWVLEGERIEVKVSCATGKALAGSELVVAPLPPGARYDSDDATIRWTPRLDQAAVYELTLSVPSLGESGAVKIGVADDWRAPGNVRVQDPARYTEEYGLPVLHLSPTGELSEDEYRPATFVYRGQLYRGDAKLRGRSSKDYPKRSFTLRFPDDQLFDEPTLGGGVRGRRKMVLVTNFNDNSLLRHRLGFETWSALDPWGLQVKAFHAVLFLDGEYFGLYTMVDHVDKDLMALQGRWRDGNVYKAIDGEADFSLSGKSSLHDGYEKKDGDPPEGEPGAFADLEDLILFVNTTSSETFVRELDRRLSMGNFQDWWILVTYMLASDSARKNYYLYHDPRGEPWEVVPWDLDGVFGQMYKTVRVSAESGSDYTGKNALFDRFLSESAIAEPLRERYRERLETHLSAAAIHLRVDAIAAEIAPSARRDEARWGAAYRAFPDWAWRTDFLTWEEEVQYIKRWVGDRTRRLLEDPL